MGEDTTQLSDTGYHGEIEKYSSSENLSRLQRRFIIESIVLALFFLKIIVHKMAG